ncbi:unnamed protein product, partial [Discosporangium mesarthrocarpum]
MVVRFSKGGIIRALGGHPGCVEDLCRRMMDKNLFFDEQEILTEIIPQVQASYAYPDRGTSREAGRSITPPRQHTSLTPHPRGRTSTGLTCEEALT